jgi:hypothetical protein
MLHIFSVIAAATAVAMPQTGIATSAPLAVNTCSLVDTISPALMAEFGSFNPSRLLRLTFVNAADTTATQVSFDVTHDGARTTIVDRGRFSTGVPIEHLFDDLAGTDGSGNVVCSVRSITYADGHRWVAPASAATDTALR